MILHAPVAKFVFFASATFYGVLIVCLFVCLFVIEITQKIDFVNCEE